MWGAQGMKSGQHASGRKWWHLLPYTLVWPMAKMIFPRAGTGRPGTSFQNLWFGEDHLPIPRNLEKKSPFFFFSKRPFVNDSNNLPWDSYQPGIPWEYHGNTYQPAMQWMGILMRWSTRCFTAVRFHRVPAQVFSLKPVEPLFSSGIPIKKNTWTCIAASNLLHKTNVRLQWDEWWFGTFFIFPFSWECHHPNWRTHIFFRG